MDFPFFLDAWRYCYQHDIPATLITRKNWKLWTISFPEKQHG